MRKIILTGIFCFAVTSAFAADAPNFGVPADPARMKAWDISILPDGSNLPPGKGSVKEGEAIYAEKCQMCHNEQGKGQPADRLTGGIGSLATQQPIKTVASYWPYATTLFDYIRRAMPQSAPQSLPPDDVYAVSAYLLYLNDLLPADAVLDATRLAAIKMPNRAMFVDDPRPDVKNVACVTGCSDGK